MYRAATADRSKVPAGTPSFCALILCALFAAACDDAASSGNATVPVMAATPPADNSTPVTQVTPVTPASGDGAMFDSVGAGTDTSMGAQDTAGGGAGMGAGAAGSGAVGADPAAPMDAMDAMDAMVSIGVTPRLRRSRISSQSQSRCL